MGLRPAPEVGMEKAILWTSALNLRDLAPFPGTECHN